MIEIYSQEKQINNKNSNYYYLGADSQNNKDIILRHSFTISFSNYISVSQIKNVKYCVEIVVKSKDKDKNKIEKTEFELEFYSKEDLKTFKSLMKKIKNKEILKSFLYK